MKLFLLLNFLLQSFLSDSSEHWIMHVIDNTSFGADGTKLCYANQDTLPDIITGWEQGGVARLYFNPGKSGARWYYVKVPAPDVEDAFVTDLDGDGFKDIVTLSEGSRQRITFHWAPSDALQYTDSKQWHSEDVECTTDRSFWMFGVPMDIDDKNGIDLVVGSKGKNGTLGWLESPQTARDVHQWRYHEIAPAGWIMSIELIDIDQDAVEDILISDRKGKKRGIRWLKNPGPQEASLYRSWENRMIGLHEGEPMFLTTADLNNDSLTDIVVPDLTQGFTVFLQEKGLQWQEITISYPLLGGTRGKSLAAGDIDLNGPLDIVSTYEGAEGKSGIVWTSNFLNKLRQDHDISGKRGIKFDLACLLDMDGDGDLDVLTSEENNNSRSETGLGVIWYENPTK